MATSARTVDKIATKGTNSPTWAAPSSVPSNQCSRVAIPGRFKIPPSTDNTAKTTNGAVTSAGLSLAFSRRAAWKPPVETPARGYARLYMEHVLQAEHGCDFDFLRKA